jgi:regulator of cell morphogenesis and NO signaling
MIKTVSELALENPAATRVFEQLGIDYCCGGSRTLEQACRTAKLTVEQVLGSIEAAAAAEAAAGVAAGRDWPTAPLAELVAHIESTHHQYTRAEIERLPLLIEKVLVAHGLNHPELARIRETFAGLGAELRMHMMQEEMVLFPYVVRMEEAAARKAPIMPPPFGTVENPVAMMIHEHDSAGEALRELRAASNGYTAPPDACASFRTLYQALAAFEADLHQHIHLENNILFPRAIALERA